MRILFSKIDVQAESTFVHVSPIPLIVVLRFGFQILGLELMLVAGSGRACRES